MNNYKYNKPYSASWNGVKSKYELVDDTTKPLPPYNVFVTTPYITGILDIRWDNPLERVENSKFDILGVNIYKSEDSEAGPFTKINSNPIQSLYYRDETTKRLIVDENCINRLNRGTNPKKEWVITTLNKPVVKFKSQDDYANSPEDVVIKIDNGDGNLVTIPPKNVIGSTGEIFLITDPIYNPITKTIEQPRLPIGDNARIFITYWINTKLLKSNLIPRYFYKVTTVGKTKEGKLIETPLENIMPSNVNQIEKPHYIWKGIISKNRFLLEQFGERVKLFIRKENGQRCPNYVDTHKQAHNECDICFGTSYVGGFEGPIDVVIAPPEAEKHIDLTDTGLKLNFTFESWTGPSPLIRTRDFIVRQNGERMTIGSVTPQGPKGAIFQQHFMLNYRDSKDIIYKVPIHGGEISTPLSDDTRGINNPVTDASPTVTDYKNDKPRSKTDKGRTIDYENVNW